MSESAKVLSRKGYEVMEGISRESVVAHLQSSVRWGGVHCSTTTKLTIRTNSIIPAMQTPCSSALYIFT